MTDLEQSDSAPQPTQRADLKAQLITTAKLVGTAGGVGLTLWFLDQALL